jgi:hypothetical protein
LELSVTVCRDERTGDEAPADVGAALPRTADRATARIIAIGSLKQGHRTRRPAEGIQLNN